MRSLGSLGLALSIAALATTASAAPDSRMLPPPHADSWGAGETPVQPDGRAGPPPQGGWARDGWSDTDGGRGIDPGFDPGPHADGPPPRGEPEMGRPRPPEQWRRQTWDGGRGDAFAYRRGGRLPAIFVSPRYAVPDWEGYRLAPPGPGRRWVRYYDDAVLIDGRGRVIDAVPAIGWDDDFGYGPDYGPGYGRDRHWRGDGPRIVHDGRGPAPSVYYGPNGATTIVIRTEPSVATTTTTTTTETYVSRPGRRVWRKQPTRLVQTKPARTIQTKPKR